MCVLFWTVRGNKQTMSQKHIIMQANIPLTLPHLMHVSFWDLESVCVYALGGE